MWAHVVNYRQEPVALHCGLWVERVICPRKGPVSADKSITEALKGRPVAVLSAPEDDRIQYRKQAKEEGIASMLSVPMLLRGEVIGVMRVYTTEARHFTDVDMYFCRCNS